MFTGYSSTWVRTLVQRDHQRGPTALSDARHEHPGGQFLLSPAQQEQLQKALEQDPPDGGLWSGPKVAQWMEQHTGHPVHAQRGWEYVRRLGLRPRVLRPRHVKSNPLEQEALKKN
jgi:transposase